MWVMGQSKLGSGAPGPEPAPGMPINGKAPGGPVICKIKTGNECVPIGQGPAIELYNIGSTGSGGPQDGLLGGQTPDANSPMGQCFNQAKSMLGQCKANSIVDSLSSIVSRVLGKSAGGSMSSPASLFNSLAGGSSLLQSVSQSSCGSGGLAVMSGRRVGGQAAAVASAAESGTYYPGAAYICYNSGCTMGIGVGNNGTFQVLAVPRENTKFYKLK